MLSTPAASNGDAPTTHIMANNRKLFHEASGLIFKRIKLKEIMKGKTKMPSIILEPYPMFLTLDRMQHYAQEIVKELKGVGDALRIAARMTYAKDFNDLVKQSQEYINNVGYNTIRAHNKFAKNTSNIVTLLVKRFATECNARDNYIATGFDGIDILKNAEDKVDINPHFLREQLIEMIGHSQQIKVAGIEMESLFKTTEDFWQGESADNARQFFNDVTLPTITELTDCLDKIFEKGLDLVSDFIMFEKALPTP